MREHVRYVMFSLNGKETEKKFWKEFEEVTFERYKEDVAEAFSYSFAKFLRNHRASVQTTNWKGEGYTAIAYDLGRLVYDDENPISNISIIQETLRRLPEDSWAFLALNEDFNSDETFSEKDLLIRLGNYKEAPIFVDMRLLSEAHGY